MQRTHFGYLEKYLKSLARFNCVNSLKNNACSNKGKCIIQSSLTLWSTTISVMKMTAMLHLWQNKNTLTQQNTS